MIKGQIINGQFGSILARQKSGAEIELGELLVAEANGSKILMQVTDLLYGSQISQQNLELISGLNLEENNDLEFMDPHMRNYILARLKNLITLEKSKTSKTLPEIFSNVRELTKEDISFITKPTNPLFVGKLRSGSKVVDADVVLDGKNVLSHHILISGTTGRGKSELVKTMLWSILDGDYAGVLVLDPHDEYYGRHNLGLKDHNNRNKISYYTPKSPPVGTKTLKINIKNLKPHHFAGVVDFSDPQKQALYLYYKYFDEDWIEAILLDRKMDNVMFKEDTLAVVKRRMMQLLDVEIVKGQSQFIFKGVFDLSSGETTIRDICNELELGKTVIIDTSSFAGEVELLIGSLICNEIFNKYRYYKTTGELESKPIISVILEEAPRVIGKDALERGSNVFSSIAREGRKFKIGLTAITQLPSLIPRDILANMNTKIILGIEMQPERQAIIDSASQDLKDDDRTIASLDKGEAIITSNFVKFCLPIKIPMISETASVNRPYKPSFSELH